MLDAIRRNTIPLIVATALFMTNLDATVLSTSLPAVARDLGLNPIHLKLALTSYLLALAVFIPASGWVADRFGAKSVFRIAMGVFAAGSIACGFANDLGTLVAARIVQGIGGAMMMPVGRLIVWRVTPKADIISAAAWLTIPATVAPVLGPLLGGFITTYFNWRWIFWINIPVALLGLALATRFIPNVREAASEPFDAKGFALVSPGLAMFLTGATLFGFEFAPPMVVALLFGFGGLLLALYVRHALRDASPILDLRLLNIPTFRAGVAGGFLFRIGIGAIPFLLPLLLQIGFGMTAFQSGALTFATGVGALVMKTIAATTLRRFGYRRVLIANAIVAALFTALPAVFTGATPAAVMLLVFLAGGLSRSLQFTSLNTISYADVPPSKLSSATSFAAVGQELAGAVGVSIAAFGLEAMMRASGEAVTTAAHFPPVFMAVALISLLSIVFFRPLSSTAGGDMLAKKNTQTAQTDALQP